MDEKTEVKDDSLVRMESGGYSQKPGLQFDVEDDAVMAQMGKQQQLKVCSTILWQNRQRCGVANQVLSCSVGSISFKF